MDTLLTTREAFEMIRGQVRITKGALGFTRDACTLELARWTLS